MTGLEQTESPLTLLQRASDAVEMTVDNNVIVVDPRTNQMITLNAVGGMIWSELESPVSIDDLAATCAARFPNVEPGRIRSDVITFIEAAMALGVVFTVPT